jgi:hypothetical protein
MRTVAARAACVNIRSEKLTRRTVVQTRMHMRKWEISPAAAPHQQESVHVAILPRANTLRPNVGRDGPEAFRPLKTFVQHSCRTLEGRFLRGSFTNNQ